MPIKSIKQRHAPNPDQIKMMQIFSEIVNHCIRVGLENNCSTLKRLSLLSYHQLKEYPILSKYKLNAISQAAARLAQMKKDIKEGRLNRRKLWCNNCGKLMDRDVVASMNIAHKGWARFTHPRGLPDEAMRGNADRLNPLILRVHGSKLVTGSV